MAAATATAPSSLAWSLCASCTPFSRRASFSKRRLPKMRRCPSRAADRGFSAFGRSAAKMSFLRPRGRAAAEIPNYTGLQVQTSSSSVPIQIMWGVNKLAPNVIWTGVSSQCRNTQKKPERAAAKRSAAMITRRRSPRALRRADRADRHGLEWPGRDRPAVAGVEPDGRRHAADAMGLSRCSYPSQSLPYGGLAYVAAAAFDLGSSATLPSLAFEVYGLSTSNSGVTSFDSDPGPDRSGLSHQSAIWRRVSRRQHQCGEPFRWIWRRRLSGLLQSGGPRALVQCLQTRKAQTAF